MSTRASAAGGDWLEQDEEPTPAVESAATEESKAEAAPEPEAKAPAKEEKAAEPAKEEAAEPAKAEEAAPEAEAEAEAEPKKKQPTSIPKKRFDQVNNRLKQAEQQLQEIAKAQEVARKAAESGEVQQDDKWFDEREEAYMGAVINGDADGAKAIRQEIRAAEKATYLRYADQKAAQTAKEVPAAQAVKSVATRLEERFPALDKTSEDFDVDTVQDLLALQRGMMGRDKLISPADALERAAARLGMDLSAPEPTAAPAPAPAPAPEPPASLTDASTAVATAEAQPPELGSRGGFENGENEIDWATFTLEDLEALPESKQRELRGD